MSKHKINITYGAEDLNTLLIEVILKDINNNYGL